MLRVVDAGRPIAVSEQIIWRVLADIKLSLSLNTVRRELAYLRELTWVCSNSKARTARPGSQSSRRAASRGRVQLPVTGGVARPRKYW